MRVFVTWLVALGMIVSPAIAGTDKPGDDKDTTPKNGAASATAEKDKTADATANTAKPNAAAATPSSLETEIQQLRDLIEISNQTAASAERTTERTAAQDAVAGKRSQLPALAILPTLTPPQ